MHTTTGGGQGVRVPRWRQDSEPESRLQCGGRPLAGAQTPQLPETDGTRFPKTPQHPQTSSTWLVSKWPGASPEFKVPHLPSAFAPFSAFIFPSPAPVPPAPFPPALHPGGPRSPGRPGPWAVSAPRPPPRGPGAARSPRHDRQGAAVASGWLVGLRLQSAVRSREKNPGGESDTGWGASSPLARDAS